MFMLIICDSYCRTVNVWKSTTGSSIFQFLSYTSDYYSFYSLPTWNKFNHSVFLMVSNLLSVSDFTTGHWDCNRINIFIYSVIGSLYILFFISDVFFLCFQNYCFGTVDFPFSRWFDHFVLTYQEDLCKKRNTFAILFYFSYCELFLASEK